MAIKKIYADETVQIYNITTQPTKKQQKIFNWTKK